ncbi:LOW QUALITY PROTEIN: esat-6 like protein, partial [Mycobacterium tuberculosis GM 1503]
DCGVSHGIPRGHVLDNAIGTRPGHPRACSKAGRGPSEGGVHARTARLPHLLLAASWLR